MGEPKRIKILLPALHAAQLKIVREARRYNVVCCGRRWGKTVLGIDRLIQPALKGKPVAWFAPNNGQSSDVWRTLQRILRPVIVKVSEQERRLELCTGGVIEMWSLDSPDAGRGRSYAVVVIDECALVRNLKQVWEQTIRPMLMDWKGKAWFLSTPKGMNYFKTLFDRGQDPERQKWASWQMPSGENPRITPEEIEEIRSESESAFNQECLALFVDGEGSVFRRVVEAATIEPGAEPEPGHDYVIGCDWGRSRDFTVYLVVDITAGAVVDMDRSRKLDYVIQCGRLKALSRKWNPLLIIAEQNSIGQPIIEQLVRDGLPIEPITMTSASKPRIIEALVGAFEFEDIRILNDPVLVGELIAYQSQPLPSGQMRYGAPSGQHDDTVMALAMAWTKFSVQGPLVYPAPDEDLVVPDFEIPSHWQRAYGLDVQWGTAAVVWGARDPQSDVLYLYGERLAEADPAVHAAAIRSKGEWIPGLIDPSANGRNQVDGKRLLQDYSSLNLLLRAIDNPLESGIQSVRQRIQSGRLKVFSSLEQFLRERKLYRQDDRGQIIRKHDNLMDALRCLVNGILYMCTKPVKQPPYIPPKRDYGDRGWMV